MSRRTAIELWGAAAVQQALAEPNPEPATIELAREVGRRADPPEAFREWSLALPWPRFCTVVRIVSGEIRREVMGA